MLSRSIERRSNYDLGGLKGLKGLPGMGGLCPGNTGSNLAPGGTAPGGNMESGGRAIPSGPTPNIG